MGKLMSKPWKEDLIKGQEDEEEVIRRYEEKTKIDPYGYALEDNNEEDLRKVKWYHRVCCDIRVRILYALIVAVILGIAIPIALRLLVYNNIDDTVYGSCLIKPEARFQCLINNINVTRTECGDANCCWEDDNSLPFKCYHSLPSAYQYRVERIYERTGNETEPGDWIEINMQPNHQDRMKPLRVWIKWIGNNHLNLQIFDPANFPERQTDIRATKDWNGTSIERNGMIINFGKENDPLFFLQLERIHPDRNETIFDTRLGPLHAGNGFISFTTTLPTPYFYGISGGEGIASRGTLTSPAMNGFQNAEMPFYMVLEEHTNLWHGALLETTLPFITQVLQAPGISFHLQGEKAEINLHLFLGPSHVEVINQLHSYIQEKVRTEHGVVKQPYIPPYFGLGLHLCRKSFNASEAITDIQGLNEIISEDEDIRKERRLPYDTDCIDSDLRNPFGIDNDKFSEEELANITTLLVEKKIVLSQKLSIPFIQEETDISRIEQFILMDRRNSSNIHPFMGMIDNQTVIYPDVFHPDIFEDLSIWDFNMGNLPFHGMILLDNFPKNEDPVSPCNEPTSFLSSLLPNSSVCPEILHTVQEVGESRKEKIHLELHNAYGMESLRKFVNILPSLANGNTDIENGNILLSTSSAYTESLYYGANNGMEVNFTWVGLRESLAHVLRHTFLSPISSSPVCGSTLKDSPRMDANLCLRWYQMALLLPFTYHTYEQGTNSSRGPLQLPSSYHIYLREAIRERYAYAPYYYTLLIQYRTNYIPMIRPMSFHFHDVPGVDKATVFAILDQFMIGEAVLAAPIVNTNANRDVYFPPGLWYNSDSELAWSDMNQGGSTVVTGVLTHTPLFYRGGSIIPMIENSHANSITDSRKGNYTVHVALIPNGESNGALYADNGMIQGSPSFTEITFNAVSFFNNTLLQINLTISVSEPQCGNIDSEFSTTIDHIKYVGFPSRFRNIEAKYIDSSNIESPLNHTIGFDNMNNVRLRSVALDWCQERIAYVNLVARPN